MPDAIVVGARAAGSAIAIHLARAGHRVLVVDRAPSIGPTISSPLFFGNTLYRLSQLGVLPQLAALGAPPIHVYEAHVGDIELRGKLLPFHSFDYAYSIRRERFDRLLLNHAAAQPGVELRLGFAVTSVLWDTSHTRVTGVCGRTQGGAQEQIHAPLVVGADGVFSTIARSVNAPRYYLVPPRTCVYYTYYSGVPPASAEPTASVYFNLERHFALITAPSDDDLTVLSLCLPASAFPRVRRAHSQLHAQYTSYVPTLAQRFASARRATPLYGMSPRPSYYRLPYGPGWVLIGDAAFHKDPLPGQGLHDALRSAELAARAVSQFHAAGSSPQAWQRAMSQYHAVRDKETRSFYWLTDYLAHLERPHLPLELAFFRALASLPAWSDRYVSIFNGVTDPALFRRLTTQLRVLIESRLPRSRRS